MNTLTKIITGAALSLGFCLPASAITIAPTVPPSDVAWSCTGVGTGTDEAFITDSCSAMSGLTQQYKGTPGSVVAEEGPLASYYTSTFNSTSDASGGTIVWDGPISLVCTVENPCWLLVKDGNQNPGRYAFNLTGIWNGTDTITLSGFWPENGSISHWALYGNGLCRTDCRPPDEVPEPGSLALLGLGLLGLGLGRKRLRA